MRFTSTLQTFLILVIASAIIGYGVLFLPKLLEEYIGLFFIALLGLGILYVIISALLSTLNEWADGILEIYVDANQQDLHLFTYHSMSRIKPGHAPLSMIQHYFIVAENGKCYYNVLFTDSVRSMGYASGYDGFSTFEDSVIRSMELKQSLIKFSRRVGKKINLGEKLTSNDDGFFIINDSRELLIDRTEKLFGFQYKAVYMDRDSRDICWRKRI